jgi:hypothetical protein
MRKIGSRDYHRREAAPALQVPECFAALEARAQPEQVPPALAAAAMPGTEQLFLPVVINKNDLSTLIENIRSLARQWRSSIGKHGELTFYVDAL